MNHPAPSSQVIRASVPPAMLDALRIRFGDHVFMSETVRTRHGRDESAYDPMLSDAVTFAQTTEKVTAVARLYFKHEVPLIPYGAGSSLEGHLLTVAGGVSLDLPQVNYVLSVHPEGLTVTVEPGVTCGQLSTEIRDTGLFFPIDPGADAPIDGMCATRASGTNAICYDTMRENVLNLTVVIADDRIIKTANRARKSSAKYGLTHLFVGSEGTLDIITEITLKLYPQPGAVSAAVCALPGMGDAISAVINTIRMGVPITCMEFVDALVIRTINQYDKFTLPRLPALFFEFHGSEHDVQEQAETVQQIAAGHKGQDFEQVVHPEDRSRLWNARHNAYFVFLQLKPGYRTVTTDVCMLISCLAECVAEAEKDPLANALQLPAPIVGHVGDGNFHTALPIDPNKPKGLGEAGRINQRIATRAIAMDDIYTGEHGVGLHKVDFLITEYSNDMIDLMRSTEQALDPRYVLNPGKISHL